MPAQRGDPTKCAGRASKHDGVERLPGESDAGVGHLRAFGSDRRGLATSVGTVPALTRLWQASTSRVCRARRFVRGTRSDRRQVLVSRSRTVAC